MAYMLYYGTNVSVSIGTANVLFSERYLMQCRLIIKGTTDTYSNEIITGDVRYSMFDN